MPTFTEGLAALFGLEPDADEDTILAAATEALAERAEDTRRADDRRGDQGCRQVRHDRGQQGPVRPDDRHGGRPVGSPRRTDQGRERGRDPQRARVGAIDGPVAEIWRKSLETNREATLALMATLPANKAVPVDEIGHGVSREDQPEDADKAYAYARITGKTIGKDA